MGNVYRLCNILWGLGRSAETSCIASGSFDRLCGLKTSADTRGDTHRLHDRSERILCDTRALCYPSVADTGRLRSCTVRCTCTRSDTNRLIDRGPAVVRCTCTYSDTWRL